MMAHYPRNEIQAIIANNKRRLRDDISRTFTKIRKLQKQINRNREVVDILSGRVQPEREQK